MITFKAIFLSAMDDYWEMALHRSAPPKFFTLQIGRSLDINRHTARLWRNRWSSYLRRAVLVRFLIFFHFFEKIFLNTSNPASICSTSIVPYPKIKPDFTVDEA